MYEVETTSREVIYVDSPSKLPAVNNIYELREPIAECHMLPQAYLGNVITLCVENTACKPIWFTTVIRWRQQYEIQSAGSGAPTSSDRLKIYLAWLCLISKNSNTSSIRHGTA